ncbi:hypothetical protein F5B20DRAFT_523461 [Whalleya microplaca]|nr:hypothetical protein F5B20DRAFT_523461 [Whalleya microplaca]
MSPVWPSGVLQQSWLVGMLATSCQFGTLMLFSTSASITGHGGQINQAAVNTFMDTFAHFRYHNSLVAEVDVVSRSQDNVESRVAI